MGYRRQPKVFRLTFEDEPELEVYVRSAPLGQILGLLEFAKALGGDFKPEDVERLDELFAAFVSCLKEWNLEDEDGTPIPATIDGLKSQDMDFVLELIMAWMEAVVSVSAPLKRKSSSGDQSPEGSIPMEVAA